jgi:hypothetical protein
MEFTTACFEPAIMFLLANIPISHPQFAYMIEATAKRGAFPGTNGF